MGRPRLQPYGCDEMKLSLKRGDLLQLQVLKRAIQSGTPISGNRRVRARFVLALRRIIEDKYPARPNSRPRKDARNISLAVDFLIRCKRPRATKMAESRELSLECENYGIKISAAAIRKLPMRHPRAK